MITSFGKYYLYRHIREDKNEPFYIGVGTIKRISCFGESRYERSKSLKRNPIWERIVAKTSYEVEILIESNDYEFIKFKEIEFIKLYGRIDVGTGTLANMTDGGEGQVGRKVSVKSIEKLIERSTNKIPWNKGKSPSEDVRKQISLSLSGRKVPKEVIQKVLDSKRKGFDSYKISVEHKKNIGKANSKYVLQLDMNGNLVREFESCHEVERLLGIKFQNIAYSCKKEKERAGFMWKYK